MEEIDDPKNHFEITWPLRCSPISKYQVQNFLLGPKIISWFNDSVKILNKKCDLYYLLQKLDRSSTKFEKKTPQNFATSIKSDKIANLRHLQNCIYTKDAFKYKITKCKKNNPWPTHSNKCTYLPIEVRKKHQGNVKPRCFNGCINWSS